MAIVKMKKLHLVAMSYDRNAILDALHKTNAAEIKWQTENADTVAFDVDGAELSARIAAVEAALTALVTETDNYEKDRKIKSTREKDGFDVTYSEFVSAADRQAEAEEAIAQIAALADRRNALKNELVKARRELAQATVYQNVPKPFSFYINTTHACARVGTIPAQTQSQLLTALDGVELAAYELFSQGEQTALAVYSHKDERARVDGILSSCGFTDCPYRDEWTGAQLVEIKAASVQAILDEISSLEVGMYALSDKIRLLKIYYDYLSFQLEKERVGEKIRRTRLSLIHI